MASGEYREGDLQKFFGVDPDFTGDLSTEQHLDRVRRGDSSEHERLRSAVVEAACEFIDDDCADNREALYVTRMALKDFEFMHAIGQKGRE